jgi:hypothetical protein
MQRACARKLFLRQLRVTTDLFSQSVTFASKPGGPPLTFHLSRSARLREPPGHSPSGARSHLWVATNGLAASSAAIPSYRLATLAPAGLAEPAPSDCPATVVHRARDIGTGAERQVRDQVDGQGTVDGGSVSIRLWQSAIP